MAIDYYNYQKLYLQTKMISIWKKKLEYQRGKINF